MKLAYFDDFRLGVVTAEGVVDVTDALHAIPRRDNADLMAGLIERFADYREKLAALAAAGAAKPLAAVTLRAPLPRPRTIVCMAVNYDDGLIAAPHVNAFHKTPSAIIGPGETMELQDIPASVFEGEAEMAVVIGRTAANVSVEDALDHVFGYVNMIDGSARGIEPSTNSFFQMKSRETFAPIGPYLVTADEIADPQDRQIRLWVNGTLKQDFNTAKMVTRIRESIAWLSAIQRLEPGDIVATGTDHCGLNALHDGDVVELETQGLGRLTVRVRDGLKRTWSRETRLERHRKGLPTLAPQLGGKYAPAKTA